MGSLGFYLGGGSRRNGVETLKPTDVQIRDQILPTLKHALDDTLDRDFDIISSCMVAMAKIGVEHPDFRLLDIFRARLGASNQEIRETAALSLGIAGLTSDAESQMDLLVGLTLDNKVGRSASKQAEVNNRTRSFAAYGLGLVAHSTPKLPIKRRAFVALRTILQSRKLSGYNLRVAAVHGMSLLNLENQSDPQRQVVYDRLD